MGDMGEANKVGPDLSYIGLTAGGRVAGMSAAGYLRQSITDPDLYLAPECPQGPCPAHVMPQNYQERLTPEQIDQVVAFLLELQGPPRNEVSLLPVVVGDDVRADPAAGAPLFEFSANPLPAVPAGGLLAVAVMSLVMLVGLAAVVFLRRR